ncbi:MAG: hypothetical protein ACOX3T_05485 [Bdellovibrionota bacterium]
MSLDAKFGVPTRNCFVPEKYGDAIRTSTIFGKKSEVVYLKKEGRLQACFVGTDYISSFDDLLDKNIIKISDTGKITVIWEKSIDRNGDESLVNGNVCFWGDDNTKIVGLHAALHGKHLMEKAEVLKAEEAHQDEIKAWRDETLAKLSNS